MARTTPPAPPPAADPEDTASAAGTDSTDGTDGTDSAASGTPAPGGNPNRFFAWLRSLGLDRQPGWVGGISAGIAARIGIDPLIVRGGFVVVALLGGPALLVYAVAWLVLPDTQDKIQLEQVLRGRFESAMAGIAALVALSMLPLTQGFWFAGSAFWGDPVLPDSIGRALWTFIVLGLLTWGIVWMVRRSNAAQAQRTAPSGPPAAGPASPAADAAASTTLTPPPAPAPNAPEADFAAWRDKQQAWKNEYETYRTQNLEASLRAQEKHRQRRLAATAASAERMREWHRANPRLRASIVFMILGAAIVAGGLTSQLVSANDQLALGIVSGLAVATLVVGIGIVLAALFRRRNGFLSFVAMLLLPATLIAAFLPRDRELIGIDGVSIDTSESARLTQFTGRLYIDVPKPDAETASPVTLDVWQGAGSISIDLAPGSSARVVIVQRAGRVGHTTSSPYYETPDLKNDYTGDGVVDANDDFNGDGTVNREDGLSYTTENSPLEPSASRSGGEDHYDDVFGQAAGGTPTTLIRIWQGYGSVDIQDAFPEEE